MARTMKAAVVEKFGEPLVVRELPVPTPGPGQVLVEIFASGVCHTDLHAAEGDWPVKPTLPFTPGHEGAGTVVELGPGVTHLNIGDRVGIAWLHSACGHCKFCLSGWETLCLEQKNSGYSVDGSFAQYALAQADYVGRIPENLSFVDAAPILCAGVTTYKGLKETETRPGDWVVISGIGGLGHVAIQYATAMGLRVAAVDLGPQKMELARKLGAEIAVDAKTQDPAAEIQKQIGGAQGVLVTAVSTIAFKQAMGMLTETANTDGLKLTREEQDQFAARSRRMTQAYEDYQQLAGRTMNAALPPDELLIDAEVGDPGERRPLRRVSRSLARPTCARQSSMP